MDLSIFTIRLIPLHEFRSRAVTLPINRTPFDQLDGFTIKQYIRRNSCVQLDSYVDRGQRACQPCQPRGQLWIDYVTVAIVDAPGRNVYTGVQRVSTSPSPPFTARKQFTSARIPLRCLCRDLCFVANSHSNLDPASKLSSKGHAMDKTYFQMFQF